MSHDFPLLEAVVGFDWDDANRDKNLHKHGVSFQESEQVFFNQPLLIHEDKAHSMNEQRFQALGQTDAGRRLFLAFTIRNRKIRIISARNQSAKERIIYEKAA